MSTYSSLISLATCLSWDIKNSLKNLKDKIIQRFRNYCILGLQRLWKERLHIIISKTQIRNLKYNVHYNVNIWDQYILSCCVLFSIVCKKKQKNIRPQWNTVILLLQGHSYQMPPVLSYLDLPLWSHWIICRLLQSASLNPSSLVSILF